MASLTSLHGTGGGRIPMDDFSYHVSRRDLAAIIDAMPLEACRALHIAAHTGDTITAQRLLREATEQYFIAPPAAPAAPPLAPRRHIRHVPQPNVIRLND
jgi:hypothetical protein